jgi:hypothetical protein
MSFADFSACYDGVQLNTGTFLLKTHSRAEKSSLGQMRFIES